MRIETTGRGFKRANFADRNRQKCSIQESSADPLDMIWLGCDQGVHVKDEHGQEVCCARMHLNREIVRALMPHLKKFLKTGHL